MRVKKEGVENSLKDQKEAYNQLEQKHTQSKVELQQKVKWFACVNVFDSVLLFRFLRSKMYKRPSRRFRRN
jgi:hypothetical protein